MPFVKVINDVDKTDAHRAYMVGAGGYIGTLSPSPAAGLQVADFASPASDWDSGGTSTMFGVCLQAVSAQTTAAWTVDAANVAGRCQSLDTDPWYAVPATPTKIASTLTPGGLGRADLVWGFRTGSAQAPGTYRATVVFEALAPAV